MFKNREGTQVSFHICAFLLILHLNLKLTKANLSSSSRETPFIPSIGKEPAYRSFEQFKSNQGNPLGIFDRIGEPKISEKQVERELNDPDTDWDRVKDNPDFILLKKGMEVADKRRMRSQLLKRRSISSQMDNLNLIKELPMSGRPVYYELPDGAELDNYNIRSPAVKRGKIMRLSLTDNIDVLREKLFMEIARRNRLLNQNNQVASANAGLDNIG